jgi:hypothetical protein
VIDGIVLEADVQPEFLVHHPAEERLDPAQAMVRLCRCPLFQLTHQVLHVFVGDFGNRLVEPRVRRRIEKVPPEELDVVVGAEAVVPRRQVGEVVHHHRREGAPPAQGLGPSRLRHLDGRIDTRVDLVDPLFRGDAGGSDFHIRIPAEDAVGGVGCRSAEPPPQEERLVLGPDPDRQVPNRGVVDFVAATRVRGERELVDQVVGEVLSVHLRSSLPN